MTTPDHTCVLRPAGTISATNAAEFRQELAGLVEAGHLHVLIDLGRVDMIDAAGLSVFVQCYQALSSRGGSLIVMTDNHELRSLFQLMGLDPHFTIQSCDAA